MMSTEKLDKKDCTTCHLNSSINLPWCKENCEDFSEWKEKPPCKHQLKCVKCGKTFIEV
jgi:hypothetical protein